MKSHLILGFVRGNTVRGLLKSIYQGFHLFLLGEHRFLLVLSLSLLSVVLTAFPKNILASELIVSDMNAPTNHRPTLLLTGSGIPQVNIATPSRSGVSLNEYQHFNVGDKGAILNNSRKPTNTQIAGGVQGNSNLARGEASVIVNQVNSNKPSHLNGYIEVAGKKADVIVANPTGLSVNGGGFLNAGKVVLNAGTTQVNGNQITHKVTEGKINLTGKGLDVRGTDYTALLARGVRINGKIHQGKGQLDIVTGKNTVNHDGKIMSTDQSASNQSSGATSADKFAIDTGALGGMYAGKIRLVGTEKGVGVNHEGAIQSDQLTLSADGQLVNRGVMNTTQTEINLGANTLDNSGELSANQFKVSAKSLVNSGSISLSNSKGLAIKANQITNTSGAEIGAPKDSKSTGPAPTNPTQPSGTNVAINSQQGTIHLSGNLTNSGKLLTNGDLSLEAQDKVLNQGNLTNKDLTVKARALDNQGVINGGLTQLDVAELFSNSGSLKSTDTLNIKANTVDNQKMMKSANMMTIKADQLTNNGTLMSGKNQELSLNKLTNHKLIATNGQQILTANQVTNNESAEIDAASFDWQINELSNQGQIVHTGNQSLSINAKVIKNANDATIGKSSKQLTNQASQLPTSQKAKKNKSTKGNPVVGKSTQSHRGITISGELNNKGRIVSNEWVNVSASSSIDNAGEFNVNQLTAKGDNLKNTGDLQAKTLLATVKDFNNQSNITGDNLMIDSDRVTNTGSEIGATKLLSIRAKGIDNDKGKLKSKDRLNVISDSLSNTSGEIISSSATELKVADTLDNTDGKIQSNGRLQVGDNRQKLTLNNKDGLISSKDISISVKNLANQGELNASQDLSLSMVDDFEIKKDLTTGRDLQIATKGNLTISDKLSGGRNIFLSGKAIHNQSRVNAEKSLQIKGDTLSNLDVLNSQQVTVIDVEKSLNNFGRIFGDHIAIEADKISQLDASVIGARKSLNIGANTVVNAEGSEILSKGTMRTGSSLDNNLEATGVMGSLRNEGSRIQVNGDAKLAIKDFKNINTNFKTEEREESSKGVREYGLINSAERYIHGVDGTFHQARKSVAFYFYDPNKRDINLWKKDTSKMLWQHYTEKTFKEHVVSSLPGELIVGGNLEASGDDWLNDKSQILVGKKLTQKLKNKLVNTEVKGKKRVSKKGSRGSFHTRRSGGIGRYGTKWRTWGSYQPADEISTYDFKNPVSRLEENLGDKVLKDSDIDDASTSKNKEIVANSDFRTLSGLDIKIPDSKLFNVDANRNVLINTNRDFLNSGAPALPFTPTKLVNSSRFDENLQQRLGDSYYEQRLIQRQIASLTGKRFADGFNNDLSQYETLLNQGAEFTEKYGISPGISLSESQMANLTNDVVLLENHEITLEDGSVKTVLVPKVYLKHRKATINTAGSIISADVVDVNAKDSIDNQGAILGNTTSLASNNVEVSGSVLGRDVVITANDKVSITGGQVIANDRVIIDADKVDMTTTTVSRGNEVEGGTSIDRVAGVYIDSAADAKHNLLSIRSKDDMNIKAGAISNNGKGGQTQLLSSEGNVNLATVDTSFRSGYGEVGSKNFRRLKTTEEIGSQISARGDVMISAKEQANIRQSNISSESGQVALLGEEGVNITEGRNTVDIKAASFNKSGGFLSKSTTTKRYDIEHDESVSSNIVGKKVAVISGSGDVNIQGSNVVSDQSTYIKAAKDVNITSAENTYKDDVYEKTTKSGLLSLSPTSISIGRQMQSTDSKGQKVVNQGAMVGTIKEGNTTIVAGENYLQKGSSVSALDGDVNVIAKQIDVVHAENKNSEKVKTEFKQSALTIAVTGAIASAVNNVKDTVTSAGQIGKSKNNRVNAMAAGTAGLNAIASADAVQNAMDNPSSIGVSVSLGSQKRESTRDSQSTTAASSSINARGKVNLQATGGDESSINIVGSDVAGKGATQLTADHDVNIVSAEELSRLRSKNKSKGGSIGVSVDTQTGVGGTLSANKGKGYANGDEVTHRDSRVGDAGSKTTINAGNKLKVSGAQVLGESLKVRAKELEISSRQDTANYKSKQKNVGGSLTVGTAGVSGSVNFGKSKVNSDYAAVKTQSGLFAGDGGYDVEVTNHTRLNGGIITSSKKAEAERKNRFSTGTLSAKDIANRSDYKGEGFSVDLGFSVNTDSKTKETTFSPSQPVVGVGSDSGNARSVTKAGINTANITITNKEAQSELNDAAGKDIVASVKTDRDSESVLADTGLANLFNAAEVESEINTQIKVTREFRQKTTALVNNVVEKKQAELREQVKSAKTIEEKKAALKAIYSLQYKKRLLQTAIGILSGTPDSSLTLGTLQLAATKLREETLKNSFKSPGVKDAKTGQVVSNVSYDSGYFDGVKLGGVRVNLDLICGKGNEFCTKDANGMMVYNGDGTFDTLADKLNPNINENISAQYGATGGFQGGSGEWILPVVGSVPYQSGSLSDTMIESFAGTHDMLGGQMWGFYRDNGNTSRNRSGFEDNASSVITALAIPISAPVAVSDLLSQDVLEALLQVQ